MYAHVHAPPPPLRSVRPDLSPAVEAIVARQLAKRPEERFSSGTAFVNALRAAAGDPRQSQPPTPSADPDGPVLARAANALAAGDWQAALRDLAALSRPAAPAAQDLRQRAEMLRDRQFGARPAPGPPAPAPMTLPGGRTVLPPPPTLVPAPPPPSPGFSLSPRVIALAAAPLVLLGVLLSVAYELWSRYPISVGDRAQATATAGPTATSAPVIAAATIAPTPAPPTATTIPPTPVPPTQTRVPPSATPIPPTPSPVRPTPTVDEGPPGREVADEGVDHVDEGKPITYKSRPPASGTHYPLSYPTYGFFEQTLPSGAWVHNLEHGTVAILYNCRPDCPEIKQQLKELYPILPLGRNSRQSMPRALIFPYTDMDSRIAVVTWDWILELDTVEKDKILHFVEDHLDRGPECNADRRCPFP
jgi:serine/threonine-protein kinase